MIAVAWTGPNGDGDYLDTAVPEAEDQAYLTYVSTVDGSPARLRLPAQPGDYVIRYVMADGYQVLAERPVTVTEQQPGLDAPDSAAVGATIMVAWQGAGYSEDYLATARPGDPAGAYLTYANVVDGNPVPLVLPLEPGPYELRYITGQDTSIFASRSLTVTDIPTTLDAPDAATAGSTITVAWQGPGYDGDYLTVVMPGDGPAGYVTYAYIDPNAPTQIELPAAPGAYELRYVATGNSPRVMASRPIAVQ